MSDKTKTVKVSNTDDLKLALAAGYEADQIVFDNTDAVAKAKAEGVAEGKASASSAVPDVKAIREEAAKAERTRVAKLQALSAEGFDAELKAAIEDGSTPEAFALKLVEAAKDRGITLTAIKKDSPSAKQTPPSNDTGSQPKLDASAIYESRRKVSQ